MATTQLSPTGTPQERYLFLPKKEATGGGEPKGAGSAKTTQLSPIATPGQRYSFSAKTAAVVTGKGYLQRIRPIWWIITEEEE